MRLGWIEPELVPRREHSTTRPASAEAPRLPDGLVEVPLREEEPGETAAPAFVMASAELGIAVLVVREVVWTIETEDEAERLRSLVVRHRRRDAEAHQKEEVVEQRFLRPSVVRVVGPKSLARWVRLNRAWEARQFPALDRAKSPRCWENGKAVLGPTPRSSDRRLWSFRHRRPTPYPAASHRQRDPCLRRELSRVLVVEVRPMGSVAQAVELPDSFPEEVAGLSKALAELSRVLVVEARPTGLAARAVESPGLSLEAGGAPSTEKAPVREKPHSGFLWKLETPRKELMLLWRLGGRSRRSCSVEGGEVVCRGTGSLAPVERSLKAWKIAAPEDFQTRRALALPRVRGIEAAGADFPKARGEVEGCPIERVVAEERPGEQVRPRGLVEECRPRN